MCLLCKFACIRERHWRLSIWWRPSSSSWHHPLENSKNAIFWQQDGQDLWCQRISCKNHVRPLTATSYSRNTCWTMDPWSWWIPSSENSLLVYDTKDLPMKLSMWMIPHDPGNTGWFLKTHILFSFGDALHGVRQNKLMSYESLFICNLF